MKLTSFLLLFASLIHAGGNYGLNNANGQMGFCERACSNYKNCCACGNKKDQNISFNESVIYNSPVTQQFYYTDKPSHQNNMRVNETDKFGENNSRKRIYHDLGMKTIRSFSDKTDRDRNNLFDSFEFDILFNCKSADCSFDFGNLVKNRNAERRAFQQLKKNKENLLARIEKGNNSLNPEQTEKKKVNSEEKTFQTSLKPSGDQTTERRIPKLKKNKQNLLNSGSFDVEIEKDNNSLSPEQTDQKKYVEVEIQAHDNLILNEIDQYTQQEDTRLERSDADIKKNMQNVRGWIDEADKVKKSLNFAEAEIQVDNDLILNEFDQKGCNSEMKKNIKNVQSQIDAIDKDENTQWTQKNTAEDFSSQQKLAKEKSVNHILSNQKKEKLDDINKLLEKDSSLSKSPSTLINYNYNPTTNDKVNFFTYEQPISITNNYASSITHNQINSITYKAKSTKHNKRKKLQEADWGPELEDMNDILTPSPNQRSGNKTIKLSVNEI